MSALDKKKTFTDMQFINLGEPDISIKAVKQKSLATSPSSITKFVADYGGWRVNYRTSYNPDVMARYGYDVVSEGQIDEIDPSLMEENLNTQIPNLGETISTRLGVPSIQEQMYLHLQTNSTSWSNVTKVYNTDYVLDYVSYKENGTETDYNTIVGVFDTIATPGVFIEVEIPNTYKETSMLIVTYYEVGETEEYLYFFQDESSVPVGTITSTIALMSPVIDLKVDGVLVEDDPNSSIDRVGMMRRLNVRPEDFEENLSELDEDDEPVIDNAYLINGLTLVNPYIVESKSYDATEAEDLPTKLLDMVVKEGSVVGEDEDKIYTVSEEVATKYYDDHLVPQAYLARALFKTFAFYSNKVTVPEIASGSPEKIQPYYLGVLVPDFEVESSSSFRSSHSLSLQYSFSAVVVTVSGSVRPSEIDTTTGLLDPRKQGSYELVGDDKKTLVIKTQISETEYQEMTITDYTGTFFLSSKTFNFDIDTKATEHRLVLPYFVVQEIKFTEYVTIHEHSFCMIAYATKTTVVKWYVRFAGVILGALLCLLGPGGCAIGSLLVDLVISVVTTIAIEKVMELVTNDVLKMLLQVAFTVIQIYMGNPTDFAAAMSENFLSLASQVTQLAFGFYQQQGAKVAAEEEAKKQANENIDDRLSNYNDSTITPPMSLEAHSSFISSNGPEALFNGMLESTLDYDQFHDMTGELDLRIKVVAG